MILRLQGSLLPSALAVIFKGLEADSTLILFDGILHYFRMETGWA